MVVESLRARLLEADEVPLNPEVNEPELLEVEALRPVRLELLLPLKFVPIAP